MSKPLKVLILCNDFPPLNSIGARRPYSWWKYFKDYGIEPVIITKHWPNKVTSYHDLLKQIETSRNQETSTEHHQCGNIIRVQNNLTAYEKLLLHHNGILWTIIRKCVTLIWRFLYFLFPYFDASWNLYLESVRFVANNQVDMVITTGEPFILHKYGHLLKKQFDIKWIADYRDGWFLHQDTRFSKNPVIIIWRQWEKIFEKKYLQNVDSITAAFPTLCKELKVFLNKPVHVIINGYEGLIKKNNEVKSGAPVVFTFGGNVTAQQSYGLFLDSICELKQEGKIHPGDILIQFIGGGHNPLQKNLLSRYITLLPDILVLTPRVPIEEARQMCAHSDYLLLFLMTEYKHIPSKLFEYLSLQRPMVVIPNDNDVVQDIVKDTKTGMFYSDIDEIKKFVLAQIALKKKGYVIPATNVSDEYIFKYSRKYQAQLLADIVKADVLNLPV